jgi:hypothetical protein
MLASWDAATVHKQLTLVFVGLLPRICKALLFNFIKLAKIISLEGRKDGERRGADLPPQHRQDP